MKKIVSLSVVMVLVLTLLPQAAFAETKATVTRVPTLKADTDLADAAYDDVRPSIHLTAKNDISDGSTFRMTLSSNAEWTRSSESGTGYDFSAMTDAIAQVTLTDALLKDDYIIIPLKFKTSDTAEVTLNISMGGSYGINDTTLVVMNPGRLPDDAKIELESNPSYKNGVYAADITISANRGAPRESQLTLVAPKGFRWVGTEDITVSGSSSMASHSLSKVSTSNGGRTLTLSISAKEVTGEGTLTIKGLALEPTQLSEYGTIKVQFAGFGLRNTTVEMGSYNKDDIATPEEPEEVEEPEEPEVPEVPQKLLVTMQLGSKEMHVGDEIIMMDTEPVLHPETQRTLIPIRFVSKALGIDDNDVDWIDDSKEVVIRNETALETLYMKIGASDIRIVSDSGSERTETMDQSAVIYDNRTFVPVRTAELLGATVDWVQATKTITIEK